MCAAFSDPNLDIVLSSASGARSETVRNFILHSCRTFHITFATFVFTVRLAPQPLASIPDCFPRVDGCRVTSKSECLAISLAVTHFPWEVVYRSTRALFLRLHRGWE